MAQEAKSLSPSQWEQEYSKGTPHWAEDKNPSKFAQDFVKLMQEEKCHSLLEIGCGNGRDSIFFSNAGFRAIAIDVSESAVELAEGNIKEAKARVNIQVANAEKLPFKNREFDAVFSLSVLHSTNLKKSLSEVDRVLRSGGIAFIYIYGDTQYATGKVKDIIATNDYIELLKSIGFIILDFYTEQEEDFDEYGERHKLLIATLRG